MNIIWLQVMSLIYIIFLNIVYFYKKRFSSLENKLFVALMISNAIGLIIEISCYFSVLNMDTYPILNIIITRGLLFYYLIWLLLFTVYVFIISYNKEKTNLRKYKKRVGILIGIIFTISYFMLIFLPLNYYNQNNVVYSYGPAVQYLYLIYTLLMSIWGIVLIINFKQIKNKKYSPIIIFIIFGALIGYLQSAYPYLLLTTALETFIVFLMYFTIENPDMRMITELNRSKEINDKINEDRINILSKITENVRVPIAQIEQTTDNIMNKKDDKQIKDGLIKIKTLSKDVNGIINNVLGISDIDSKALRITTNKYNINNLLSEISINTRRVIKDQVDFRTNFNNNIPDSLYGDSVKIKQILNTILDNSIKYTRRGFIEFSVQSIIKQNICRLIFTIEDSGIGMDIKKVNDLLDNTDPLVESDLKIIDESKLNINIITKIIHLLRGNVNITSELGKGTKVTVILDQRIVESEKSNINPDLDKIEEKIFDKKKIFLVTEDDKINNKLSKIITNLDFYLETYKITKDCLDKIRNNEKVDLIIIQEDMSKIDAHSFLIKIKDYGIPIILISKNKEPLTLKKYKMEGFIEVINIPLQKQEISNKIESIIY